MTYKKIDFNKLVGVLTPGDDLTAANVAPEGSGNATPSDLWVVGTDRSFKYQEVSGRGVARAIVNAGAADDGNIQLIIPCSGTVLSVCVEYGPNTDPNAQARTIQLNTPLGYAVRLEIAFDGSFRVYTPGTGSNNDMTGTAQVDTASGFRIWLEATIGTAGAQTVRAVLFNGSDGRGTTPTEELLSTTATTQDGTTFDDVSIGVVNNAGEATFDYRNIQLEDSSLGDLGPIPIPPVVSGTPVPKRMVPMLPLISDGGGAGAPYSIVSVTQTVGTPVTNLDHDDTLVVFWCDESSIVDSCTFSAVIADSSSEEAEPFLVNLEPGDGGLGGPYILNASGVWVQ